MPGVIEKTGPLLVGLRAEDALARLKSEGYNELAQPSRRTPLRIALGVVREPMFGLLLTAGALYLVLGDLQDALTLLVFACLSVSIAVIQESRAERVLEALRDLTSPRALIIRDGKRQRIPGREVVRGDVIVVAEGDRVPADATLVSGLDVQADESLLTGESVPVRKCPVDHVADGTARPGGDDLPDLFSGTLVVRGHGIAVVKATGARSEIGKIGETLVGISPEQPRLTLQTRWLVRGFAVAGLSLSAVAVVLYGLLRGGWLDALLSGIALGMSMLPEEFPLVLTAFMAIGAWRLSRIGVLTRKAAAIETLGAATVLCTDKTGTLTQNRMSIAEVRAGTDLHRAEAPVSASLTPASLQVIEIGALASKPEAVDPMEQAFHTLAGGLDLRREGTLMHEYGLSPALLAVTHVWRVPGHDDHIVAAKGAPEAIAALCRMDTIELEQFRRAVDEMASGGLRVLGVARASFAGREWPASQQDFAFEFLGLVGLSDPLHPSVPHAVKECRNAGVRVVMITGDYPATARAIARSAGIDAEHVMAGDELARLSDAELADCVRRVTVFARIMPEQKLRIVEALKANGDIVAMTGDGVNDAPSLKAAHIGIAMGGRGTDVAREAASIVLLDDDFTSIAETIRLGRRIYDNLRKAMGYILAVHVPIVGLALLPIVLGWPLMLMPIHIAFLEMVIDPVCSIVFEAEREERNVMSRPPRAPESPLFSAGLVGWSLIQGMCALVLVVGVQLVAMYRDMPESETRALTFATLMLTNIGLILVNRSFSTSLASAFLRVNTALWAVLAVTGALLGLAVIWPPAQALFRFGPLHADDLAISAAAGVAVLLLLELLKPFWRTRLQS